MKLPVIIVNFKVYEQAMGKNAVKLAKIHEEVAKETGASIAIAVSALDLQNVIEAVSIPVFAQHVDPVGYGSNTGHIVPEQVKRMGAYGTLLNHAERQLPDDVLKRSIKAACDAGLYVVACANTPERGREILEYAPNLVAVEPPDLIGGDISVSKAEAHIIKDAVAYIGEHKCLVGAGIRDAEDVRIALQYGASGVLLASGVIRADDPKSVLMDLVSGLK